MVIEYLWTWCHYYTTWGCVAYYQGGPYLWPAPLVFQS